MYKLYMFHWYDPGSDNGYNEEYLITDEPVTHSEEIGFNCKYEEFEQEGFIIQVMKGR